jgi:hypothetical protein
VALIQQTVLIKAIAWNPLIPSQLAFCCGNGLLYLWEENSGCDAIQVPAGISFIIIVNFNVTNFKWNPDGRSVLLLDKDKFCLSFIVDE